MKAFLNGPLGADFALLEAIGVALALALIVALRFMLPKRSLWLLRTPVLLLALNLAVFALVVALRGGAGAHRILSPIAELLLLLSIGRSAVLLILDVLLGPRRSQPLPRIFRDIIQGVAFAGIALIALHSAGVEPGSLLTTSAVLTAVLGLALQDTLGNIFAGLAIQMQRPFDVGDWIQFDSEPKNAGRVIEINWRATTVVTLDEVEVIVPNATLARVPIKNFTKPTIVSRRSIYVQAPYNIAPAVVHGAILAAIADAPGVVRVPAPSVVTNQFSDSGIEYWVRFFTDQFGIRDGIDSGVRERIWHAFHRAGIHIPLPGRTVHVHEVTEERGARVTEELLAKRSRALRCVDFFRVLSDEEHRRLAETATSRLYAPGEVIVRQGDDGHELYVIERGEVVVVLEHAGVSPDEDVARLGPGKFFGEMALVTGDRRQATVRAETSCELLEVGREAMHGILERSPDLAERLSAVFAERQAELELRATAGALSAEVVMTRKTEMLEKIKEFFAL